VAAVILCAGATRSPTYRRKLKLRLMLRVSPDQTDLGLSTLNLDLSLPMGRAQWEINQLSSLKSQWVSLEGVGDMLMYDVNDTPASTKPILWRLQQKRS